MHTITIDERRLLHLWDDAAPLARPWKEVNVLAHASNRTPELCARLSIGERDRLLMELHDRLFGQRYDGETECSQCGAAMAFGFTADDVPLQQPEADGEALMLTEGRITVRIHLPTSADVAECLEDPNPAMRLFIRCVRVLSSPAHRMGKMGARELPLSLRQSIVERMAALDPGADLVFELACPACGHDAKVLFDPVAALFQEHTGHRIASQSVQSGPGAGTTDYLDRLIARHRSEQVVFRLQEPTAVDAAGPATSGPWAR